MLVCTVLPLLVRPPASITAEPSVGSRVVRK
jgi:hypothetical protein